MDQNKYHGKCSPKAMACGGMVQKKALGGVVNAMEWAGKKLGTEKGKSIEAAEKFAKEGLDEEAMRSQVANKKVRDAQTANAKDK